MPVRRNLAGRLDGSSWLTKIYDGNKNLMATYEDPMVLRSLHLPHLAQADLPVQTPRLIRPLPPQPRQRKEYQVHKAGKRGARKRQKNSAKISEVVGTKGGNFEPGAFEFGRSSSPAFVAASVVNGVVKVQQDVPHEDARKSGTTV